MISTTGPYLSLWLSMALGRRAEDGYALATTALGVTVSRAHTWSCESPEVTTRRALAALQSSRTGAARCGHIRSPAPALRLQTEMDRARPTTGPAAGWPAVPTALREWAPGRSPSSRIRSTSAAMHSRESTAACSCAMRPRTRARAAGSTRTPTSWSHRGRPRCVPPARRWRRRDRRSEESLPSRSGARRGTMRRARPRWASACSTTSRSRPRRRAHRARVELGMPCLIDLREVAWPALRVDLGPLVDLGPAQVVITRGIFERRRDRILAERPRPPSTCELAAVSRMVHLADERPPVAFPANDHRLFASGSTSSEPRITAHK